MKCLKASTLISLAASVGALMAVAAPASAVTGALVSVNSATDCVYVSGAVPKISGNGNLYNSSTTSTSVVNCPIIDDQGELVTFGMAGVLLTYTDKSTAGNVSCTLSHITTNGVTLTSGAAAASTGALTTGGTLVLNPSATVVTGGRWMVKCTLPKKGGSSAVLSGYEVYVVTGP